MELKMEKLTREQRRTLSYLVLIFGVLSALTCLFLATHKPIEYFVKAEGIVTNITYSSGGDYSMNDITTVYFEDGTVLVIGGIRKGIYLDRYYQVIYQRHYFFTFASDYFHEFKEVKR